MDNLQKIYRDICKGHSCEIWNEKKIYVKHPTLFDQSDVDDYYEEELKKAIIKGIPTKEEKLNWLRENKLWSQEDESFLIQQKDFIQNMEKTKEKLMLQSQIEIHNRMLAEEKNKYILAFQKKEKLFGLTAEQRAAEKMQYFHIYLSLFVDENLENRLFSFEEISNLYDEESNYLLSFYDTFITKFNIYNIKKISVSNFFMNQFYLCGENTFNFFSIPFFKLTIYQSYLLSYGTYFKQLITNEKIPSDILSDPDKIEEYMQKSKNMRELISKSGSDGGRTGIVGATKEDFKSLNVKTDDKFIKNVTKQGVTNINDAIKMF